MHTTMPAPTHPATRPVTAHSLREYREMQIKAQASARKIGFGVEDGERYEARELKRLFAYTDAEILAGAHWHHAADLADRLVNGAASDGYDDIEGVAV